ncbi:Cyclin-I2 [Camelus dromedarius]|uniref:Cyclin-I2 n=1 Tax=Camelus dromedarius TaxID=9838 RepID=A0A5N4CRM5_CAMDR|nr:Cyclin-I2 [Camelus dromedarius]
MNNAYACKILIEDTVNIVEAEMTKILVSQGLREADAGGQGVINGDGDGCEEEVGVMVLVVTLVSRTRELGCDDRLRELPSKGDFEDGENLNKRQDGVGYWDKLHWDLYNGTLLDWLTIFHDLVVLGWPHVKELLPPRTPLHVASLTRQLQDCTVGHQLLQFKGATLALVIITLELERLTPHCCSPMSDLLKKAQAVDGFTRNL